jgi:clan AA aspartic protease (TIGR02281 family)
MSNSKSTLVPLALASIVCACLSLHASPFYEWTDGDGVKHYATTLDQVPREYRDSATPPDGEVQPRQVEAETAPPTGEEAPAPEGLRFEVPYEAFEGSSSRVIVQASIDGVTAPMALDTGSPGMVVSFELAERLGLFAQDSGKLVVQAAGIGGATPAIRTIVGSVAVGGARSTFVPTTVTQSLSESFDGLIGMDFLSRYSVNIDSQRRVVVFVENPPEQEIRGGHDEAWWRRTFDEFRAARDAWKEHAESVRGKLGGKPLAFVDSQVRESERLLQRLDLFASDNAVPRHWR